MATKLNIKPLFDNILVKPLQAEERTKSGIYLPETAKEKPQMGEVMAIGTGAIDEKGNKIPMVVKVGMKVMYTKWGGNEVKIENEEWKLVKQSDLLAIVE
jgi:chaperonin GroES